MCEKDFGHRFPDALRINLGEKRGRRLPELTFNFPGLRSTVTGEAVDGGDPWGEERIG